MEKEPFSSVLLGFRPGPNKGFSFFRICFMGLALVFGLSSKVSACTSFALYAGDIFFGMNFDYFAIPLKFLIESVSGMNVFHLSFLFEQTVDDPSYEGYFAKTCGMNSKGLFCASQEIEPHVQGRKKTHGNEVHIDDQYETLSGCSNVEQVKKKISPGQWVQYIGPSIHNMFADMNKKAMVTETDNQENFITEIEDDIMVMSNFPNHSLVNRSHTQALGVGADRYKTAYDYLMKNRTRFSVDKGFDLLSKVAMAQSDCSTLCSMVFHPRPNLVYVALDRDFDKIWKVSLNSKTIETCKGFDQSLKIGLGPGGILSADLKSFHKTGKTSGS